MKITLPPLHDAQQRVKDHPARFKTLVTPRRWGKTTLCYVTLMEKAISKKQQELAYVAPHHNHNRRIMDYFIFLAGPLFKEKHITANKSAMEIVFNHNASKISFYSLDNLRAILGSGNHFIIIDEAQEVSDPEQFHRFIAPTVWDKKGGILFTGTPTYQGSFFHTMFLKGFDPEEKDHFSYKGHFLENTFIPDAQAEFDRAEKELPEKQFRTEMLAEFVEEAGSVFIGFKDCVKGELEPFNPHDEYSIGIDLAKTHDYNVITVLNGDRHLVHYARWRGRSFEEGLNRLERIAHDFGNPVIYMDSTGMGMPIVEAARKRKLKVRDYHFSNQRKTDLIQNLQLGIERKSISYPAIPELLGELEAYQYEMLPSGLIRYNAPKGAHDDFVVSLALAFLNASKPKTTFRML